MSGSFRDLNLFGLDLSEIWQHCRLAGEQLLFGKESGLWDRYAPPVGVVPHSEVTNAELLRTVAGDEQGARIALVLPDDVILLKTETLPQAAEIHLHEVLAHSVKSSSPFGEEDTRWGWRIVRREGHVIELETAVTSSQLLERAVSDAYSDGLGADVSLEVYAKGESGMITLPGYAEAERRSHYLTVLRTALSQCAVTVLVLFGLIALPAGWTTIKAGQLEQLLGHTEERARAVTQVREGMMRAGENLVEAQHFFSDRFYYQEWLNLVASLTPDSAFLITLNLKGDSLTVNGLADNAADYQGVLAASGYFSDLSAPSAFRFDSRAKRERFTLTMTLDRPL